MEKFTLKHLSTPWLCHWHIKMPKSLLLAHPCCGITTCFSAKNYKGVPYAFQVIIEWAYYFIMLPHKSPAAKIWRNSKGEKKQFWAAFKMKIFIPCCSLSKIIWFTYSQEPWLEIGHHFHWLHHILGPWN